MEEWSSRTRLCAAILLCVCVAYQANGAQLYTEHDPVTILNNTNFDDYVLNSDAAWVVQFFMQWCGHCQRFSSVWKAIGWRIQGWQDLLNLGVVDCANPANSPLCRAYRVEFVPTIMMFDRNASLENTIVKVYRGPRGISPLVWTMINHLEAQDKSEEYYPWLFPMKALPDIWNEVTDNQLAAVIFETNTSYVGREVILSMHTSRDKLIIRRMFYEDAELYGHKLNSSETPALYLIPKTGPMELLLRPGMVRNTTHINVTSYIKKLKDILTTAQVETTVRPSRIPVTKSPVQETTESTETTSQMSSLTTPSVKGRNAVHMQDLESALHFSLRVEVGLHDEISGERLQNLKNYIKVLSKYFPGRREIKRFLQKLDTWLQAQSNLTGSEFGDKVEELQTQGTFLPKVLKWVGCKGSQERYRGYPCGVWSLFHTLTVSAVDSKASSFYPEEVLLAMKGYIHSFFGCRECAEHFAKMAKEIETGHTDKNYGILWLWKAHNRVNKRLSGDPTEDPRHLKIQFPSVRMCPKCHVNITDSDTESPSWDEPAVLDFLKDFYGVKTKVNGLTSRASAKSIINKGTFLQLLPVIYITVRVG